VKWVLLDLRGVDLEHEYRTGHQAHSPEKEKLGGHGPRTEGGWALGAGLKKKRGSSRVSNSLKLERDK